MYALSGHRRPILLEADLTHPLAEPGTDPVDRVLSRNRRQLRPTLRALHEAGKDPRVGGLVVKVGGQLSWASVHELRRAVLAFRRGGKPAVAWAETFPVERAGTASYLLASAFEEIWLQPGGELGLLGVAVETTFLRGALDRLGIAPEFGQRYEYKNAADRFLRTDFTPAFRESSDRLAESVFSTAVAAIAHDRGLDEGRVRELVDSGPRTAAEALRDGLVDRLGYRDQVYDAVRQRLPGEADLLYADNWRPRRQLTMPARARRHVALVPAKGTIGSGRSRQTPLGRSIGSDTLAGQLRAALRDDHARAVVLQVDSPGGSAVASDVIWREMVRLREAGKPVIVSMGDVAGSGGYYISCPADVILALPATITGSIGVLSGKFVVHELLERAGLTTGAVEYGAHARMYSARRPFSDAERERLDVSLDAIYDDFVAKVADGRGRSVAEIESVARGRVWTGEDALTHGLVDELGDLQDALRIARERAGLPADAPVRPPGNVPALARLTKAKNSEDPRAVTTGTGLRDLTRLLGLPEGVELLMPGVVLR